MPVSRVSIYKGPRRECFSDSSKSEIPLKFCRWRIGEAGCDHGPVMNKPQATDAQIPQFRIKLKENLPAHREEKEFIYVPAPPTIGNRR